MKNVLNELSIEIKNYELISKFFLKPPVTPDYNLEWKSADIEGIKDLLCGEHEFSEERINKSLDKIIEYNSSRTQKTLDFW